MNLVKKFVPLVLFFTSSAFAYEIGKIISIEPMKTGSKVTFELSYDYEEWDNFEAFDDDGGLGLTLMYRALTKEVLHEAWSSHEKWDGLKNQEVKNWLEGKVFIKTSLDNLLNTLLSQGNLDFDINGLQKVKTTLFASTDYIPTYEVLSTTLGMWLEKNNSFSYSTRRFGTSKSLSYQLVGTENPIALISESGVSSFALPPAYMSRGLYGTDHKNLPTVLKDYNRLLSEGKLSTY